jgi:hypothetical protein
MTPFWTVDEALTEVLDSIAKGSALPLTAEEEGALEDFYRPGFQAQCLAGADWNCDKAIVLPLAHLVGVLATLFTSASTSLGGEAASQVDPASAVRAAHVVALHSNARFRPGPAPASRPRLGPYCPLKLRAVGVPDPDQALADRLWDAFKLLGVLPRRSHRSAAQVQAVA